ncbi:MAG: PilZ domain-containing protein [Magnetococcales bacterium]|nr:PilZ domain-containing protein [Magnetococcales bacterium]MBF0156850.1 PilZ domain-containing protein [Magnetococcales bacterium]
MSAEPIQELLKNFDVVVDLPEILRVLDQIGKGQKPVQLSVPGVPSPVHGLLVAFTPPTWLNHADGGSLQVRVNDPEILATVPEGTTQLGVSLAMGGFTLSAVLPLLESPRKDGSAAEIQLAFPRLLRVVARRQISRYPVPAGLACEVRLSRHQDREVGSRPVTGQLRDINREGLSFLLPSSHPELLPGQEVALELRPTTLPIAPFPLTGTLLTVTGDGGGTRVSVQLTGIDASSSMKGYLQRIQTSYQHLHRGSVLTEESYRFSVGI